MYKRLISYAPEQIFLIQGDLKTFETLTAGVSSEIPNIENRSMSRFTIDDAKRLVSFNLERIPPSWCIVYFDVFMNDAAQTLLKTLEEPKNQIYIVFVTPHPYLIPQTIRSRVRLIPEVLLTESPEYFKSKKAVQEYIKETFSSDSDESASVRRAQATVFLDALETHVRTSSEKSKIVYEAKDMLFKANMPTKQVVEYVVAMIF